MFYFGLNTAFFGTCLAYKKKQEKRLSSPIIQSAFDIIKNDKEIIRGIGHAFELKKTFFSSLMAKYKFKDEFGEAKFKILTPNGPFTVIVNGTSQTYAKIMNSAKFDEARNKFYIPEQSLFKKMEKMTAEELKNAEIDPKTRFWTIDYVQVNNSSKSYIRKPGLIETSERNVPVYSNLQIVQDFFKVY